jgi:hypothetical protein
LTIGIQRIDNPAFKKGKGLWFVETSTKLTPQKNTVLGLIIIIQKVKFSIHDQEFLHENPNVDSIPISISRPRVDTTKLSSSNIYFNIIIPSMTRYCKRVFY